MSLAERVVRHRKRQTDRAISEAYSRLARNPLASGTFSELLQCVRLRARGVLDAPVINDRHPGVEALVNLSRLTPAYVRHIADWSGSLACWQGAVSSLARHLVAKYTVPPFLGSAWYAAGGPYADRQREWFVAHGRGASFRSLDLPVRMTRRMEHIFLASHDHFGIEYAMRRAELLGLGVPDPLVRAVLATRVATDLRNGEFWRTVWTFLIANASAVDAAQVGPLVDFIHAIRHERVAVETARGIVMQDPPQPSFSMKGRTMPSVLRLMRAWHRGLGTANGGLTWTASRLRPMLIEEPAPDPNAPPIMWQLIELTNGAQLRTEGSALHHCVASYADRCWRGASRIWSVRVRRGDRVRHALTIEVDLKQRAVIQARGWRNRPASGKALRLLHEWCLRERLRLCV